MEKKGNQGFSFVEVLVSFMIGMIVIEILMGTFICTKKIQIRETRQQEAIKYGQEMIQYVWNEKNKGTEMTQAILTAYLSQRTEAMNDYTYSFIWIPFTQSEHIVESSELEGATKCSTEERFDWRGVREAIDNGSIVLKTPKQKLGLNVGSELGITYIDETHWLVGIVSYKNNERDKAYEEYFVAYQ